jgi:hypothetical protein
MIWKGYFMLRTCVTGLSIFLLTLVFSTTNAQTSGKAAGFIRVSVPGNSQRASSLPFIPFNNSIDSIFGQQLTGETSSNTADCVVKWDSVVQSYTTVYKCGNTNDTNKDGKWFVSGTYDTSTMTINPGDGVWIQNKHADTQTVFLSGFVVMDGTRTVRVNSGANLVAYPFTSKMALNSTQLKACGAHGAAAQDENPDVVNSLSPEADYWLKSLEGDAKDGKWLDASDAVAAESIKIGRGYWYNRGNNGFFEWVESRPYQNVFSSASTVP